MKPYGCRCRLTPPAIAWLISPLAIARQARWKATIADEHAKLARAGGRIALRFHARDVNLVLGPSRDGKPVKYKVTLDGKPPGDDHGVDTAADGTGEVTSQRLYQLLRVKGDVADRTFEIEFLDPGVEAFAFTFG